MRPPRRHPAARLGFSLVELMAATAILTLLSLMAVPFAQTAKDREQEVQLLDSLTRIRGAIELYAWNEDDDDNDGDGVTGEDPVGDPDGDGILDDDRDGRVDEDGPPNYPPSLQALVDRGYLSAVPPDPFQLDKTAPPEWQIWTVERQATWYEGETGTEVTVTVNHGIFDVRSKSRATGLDGSAYSAW